MLNPPPSPESVTDYRNTVVRFKFTQDLKLSMYPVLFQAYHEEKGFGPGKHKNSN